LHFSCKQFLYQGFERLDMKYDVRTVELKHAISIYKA